MPLQQGSRLGPYEILAPLGAGGMGEVYRARDTMLKRDVAIKVLPAEWSRDGERLHRFELEAQAAAALNHPNVVSIFHVGQYDGAPYIVSELLNGETLRDHLGKGPMRLREVIEVGIDIGRGLAAAHDAGITHRDLKPENLFLTKDGRVKILDFGLATFAQVQAVATDGVTVTIREHSSPGHVLGTVGYMSPEQVRGQAADARSDIFAFGVILYEMLTGRRAFRKATPAETMTAILNEDPPEPAEGQQQPSRSLERLIRRCLEKEPDHRFQSAKDLTWALDAVGTSDSQGQPAVVLAKPWKRYLAIGAVVIAVAASVGMLVLRLGPRAVARYEQITFRRGTIFGARFAPDGKNVLYGAAWETSPPEIQGTQIGSPEFHSLGLPPGGLAAVSGTGRIAMLVKCNELMFGVCEGTLAEVPLSGGAPHELLENVRFADWSMDGQKLAVVVNDRAGKLRLEYPAGHVLYATTGMLGYPRIAPNGKSVAIVDYSNQSSDFGAVAVIDQAGKIKRLSPVYASVEGLAWSPSGDEIWYAASAAAGWSNALYAVDLRGRVREISEFGDTIRLHDIAADGRILLSTETWTDFMAGLFAGDAAEHPYAWLDGTNPNDISPDGRWFLFTEAGSQAFTVYLRKADGSPAARLGSGWAVSLSPDGKWALAENMNGSLTLLPTGAGQALQIPKGDFVTTAPIANSWWSADSNNFAFVGVKSGGDSRVYLQTPRADGLHAITPPLADPHFAITFSGDLSAAIPAGEDKIHTFDRTGKDLGELRGVESREIPIRFAVDGRLLIARRGSWPLAIYIVDVASGNRTLWKQLAPSDHTGLGPDFSLVITSTLKYYAYSYLPFISQLYVVSGLK